MYLIVGLGNPEKEYSKTRHNMGFDTINKIANKYNIVVNKNKFKAEYALGTIEDQKVILLKPQTFMNLSGEAIKECIDFYKIGLENIIVIYDDMDLEPGSIKVRKKGGSGSHNGMKSVVEKLNSEEFTRIRIGIGKPENKANMINYVLAHVTEEEYQKLEKGIDFAKDAAIEIIKNGVDSSMNKFNSKTK